MRAVRQSQPSRPSALHVQLQSSPWPHELAPARAQLQADAGVQVKAKTVCSETQQGEQPTAALGLVDRLMHAACRRRDKTTDWELEEDARRSDIFLTDSDFRKNAAAAR